MNTKNLPVGYDLMGLLKLRETKDDVSLLLRRRLHVTTNFINRLRLEKELKGHSGCVNCLEWNESGRILASASDDLHVILWDPFTSKTLNYIHTGHQGNIFSVKFLPQSDDKTLVTGAGDCLIRAHHLDRSDSSFTCSCHSGRVKRITTAPNEATLFWSAAEDGNIMQFDLRSPHTCSKENRSILIKLSDHLGCYAEAKCLAINPQRPEQLAIGANDPYIRLYDRRMLYPNMVQSTSKSQSSQTLPQNVDGSASSFQMPPGCVQYFVAGHLPLKYHSTKTYQRSLASTYLTFGSDGNELLVNLGGEQIYLFDINNKRKAKTFSIVVPEPSGGDAPKAAANGYHVESEPLVELKVDLDSKRAHNGTSMPPNVDALKLKANEAFEGNKYTLAISLYNLAIDMCPGSAVLYGNRAAAYMKRLWDGDMYAAMRDCIETIKRDGNHWKAHLRLARCLFELRWIMESDKCLKLFKAKFSHYAKDYACLILDKDIQKAVEEIPKVVEEETDEESSDGLFESTNQQEISTQETNWRSKAYDYEVRFCGHCNTTTDIKECNFFGSQNQFVVAGSDDGSFFVWDRQTTNIVRILRGDESIVNCLQPHPTSCLLATSGIDPVVRIWSPGPEDGSKNEREVTDLHKAASANQKRMNADPFEAMLLNMGIPLTTNSDDTPMQCRSS